MEQIYCKFDTKYCHLGERTTRKKGLKKFAQLRMQMRNFMHTQLDHLLALHYTVLYWKIYL